MSSLRMWKLRALWVASLYYVWGAVFLGAMTLAVLVLWHSKQEACLRWWGMALQFFGIVMVVSDLRSAQRQFKQPGLRERIRQKLAQWPQGNVTASLAGVTSAVIIGTIARATVRAPTDPNAPIEARLGALEQNFKRLDEELGKAQESLDQERAARTQAVEAERAERRNADADIERGIGEVTTGSFTFSLFGVTWLAIGLVLSSTSVEVSKWIGILAKASARHW